MTTTLRPTGPEERAEDGSRSRSYDVCVNSRPVGVIRLAADVRDGARTAVGRVEQLVIDEREQRRGRGTVGALAAEEVLRGWGCRRVEAGVPARARAALGLAAALGYRERNRNMIKELGDEPRLPRGSVARPMTEEEFRDWFARERREQLLLLREQGVPDDEAAARSEEVYRRYLPHGAASTGAALRVLVHEGAEVGTLWVASGLAPRADVDSWVFLVEVAEERRGQGHGRTLMRVAEHEALAAGGRVLGLNVYADNTPALRLYESLGYRSVEHHFVKPLV
ncbi:GNAT family N-acetyltransferase [Streptomyces sp. NPDC054796]